jgi:hypothetical protein
VKVSEPPRLATRILRIFSCHPDSEAIIGDLCERYQARQSSIWYWRQTLIEIMDTLMRSGAIFRIVMWAIAGFLVSVCWGVYFTYADKAEPIPSVVYTTALLSQPVAGVVTALYPDLPVGLRVIVVANAVTYALFGFIIEAVRQHYRPLQISR